ncbi:hypothetical protein GCM10008938_51930 [Deinococcus roseus]|uniref:Uncharacterized protein n=1 Tax=Deinococcus roseus TaxID=392414 RepID=A0ABQ2DJ63_9DEIO|nr:hypothetical protein GCM10008938_51930 [Deinococcus roseus]
MQAVQRIPSSIGHGLQKAPFQQGEVWIKRCAANQAQKEAFGQTQLVAKKAVLTGNRWYNAPCLMKSPITAGGPKSLTT